MTRLDTHEVEAKSTRLIVRLLRFSWRYRGRVIAVFCLQLLLLASTLAGLGFTGLSVDVIRRAVEVGAPAVQWPGGWLPAAEWTPEQLILGLGASVLGFALLRGLLTFVHELVVADLVHARIVPELRGELFQRLQRLSFRFFDDNATGAIINRVTTDVQLLRSFVDGVVIQGSVLLLSLLVFLAYMLNTHVALTLVSVALTPTLFVLTAVFSRWAQVAYRENRQLLDRLVRTMTESIGAVTVIKSFGSEADQRATFERHSRAVRDQQEHIFRIVSRYTPAIDLFARLNIAVLLVYGAVLVARHEVSLGELVVFAGLLQQFAARASTMAGVFNTLQQSMAGARRVFEVLDAVPEVAEPLQPRSIERFTGRVRFERVGFEYHPGKPVLEAIDFEVPAGACVGVLGATGAGKSTLLQLIPRFYDPVSGAVQIDGVDLRELPLATLRRSIGIVFQETFLFRGSVAENIAYGDPDASRASVQRAAERAGAHAFVTELPRGYDSPLEEGASNLSGGERQRLALARALLSDPPILLLDDPTTAVDPLTEADVLDAVDGAIRGRTTFIVSNRLSTLRRADFVVVLDGGRVVEHGTPAELLHANGTYARAARLQGGDQ